MGDPKKRPANYNPEKRKANAEAERHLKERPSVTSQNKQKYTDADKKYNSEYGVGAKGSGPGGKVSASQIAAAKAKSDAFYKKNGYYNVEDKTRPTTKGGERVDLNRVPMKNSAANRLMKKP